jgi:hypothetical protein
VRDLLAGLGASVEGEPVGFDRREEHQHWRERLRTPHHEPVDESQHAVVVDPLEPLSPVPRSVEERTTPIKQ